MIREHPDAPWLAVAAVCVGAFMGQLDASIVTVALPTLQQTFDASVGAVTWVGLSYLLVLVATVTAVGRFADMWGRKLLYVYGFVIFTVASVLCGLAPDLAALCVFRAFQAVGAAMLQANSLAIIVLVVEERALGKAIGLQGAAQALGLAVGPTVGGLLLAAGGWRLIFFVNVPFGVFGAVAAILLVPRSRNLLARVAFDWTGLAIFFPAVVALLSAISFGAALGWSSATSWPCSSWRRSSWPSSSGTNASTRTRCSTWACSAPGNSRRGSSRASSPTSSCSACCSWCLSISSGGSVWARPARDSSSWRCRWPSGSSRRWPGALPTRWVLVRLPFWA